MFKWAILIPTIPGREKLFTEVTSRLVRQTIRHRDVIVLTDCLPPTPDVASVRNHMLDMARDARAEYFSFVDDDDLISDDYVDAIYPLLDGTHIVQFNMAFYRSGVFTHVEYHNLICHGVYFDGVRHWRDIHHLHVTRLALAAPFRSDPNDTPFLHSEDTRWADDMRSGRRLKTNHVVNDVLYHYFYAKDDRPDIGIGPFERVTMQTGVAGWLPNGTEFDYAPGQTVIVHEPIARAWVQNAAQRELTRASTSSSATPQCSAACAALPSNWLPSSEPRFCFSPDLHSDNKATPTTQ